MPCPPPGDLSNARIEPRSTLQADSLPSDPPGKTKNAGVGSLSLLQGNFLTQELNQGLLHCRQILYQLSYEGNPFVMVNFMRQLVWAMRCPDIWSNIILGVSLKVFLDESDIYIVD